MCAPCTRAGKPYQPRCFRGTEAPRFSRWCDPLARCEPRVRAVPLHASASALDMLHEPREILPSTRRASANREMTSSSSYVEIPRESGRPYAGFAGANRGVYLDFQPALSRSHARNRRHIYIYK